MARRKHPVSNAKHSAILGVALMALGAYLLHDAYEGRGRERPFAMRFLTPS